MHPSNIGIWASLTLAAGLAHAHVCAFSRGMYGLNVISHSSHCNSPAYTLFVSVLWQGTKLSVVDYNTNAACTPLFNLPYNKFWMHHVNNVRFDLFQVQPDVDHVMVVGRVST